MKYADLPESWCHEAFANQQNEGFYAFMSKPLVDSLACLFEDSKVVEAYAGRGALSSLLQERGVHVRATSLRMGHDRTESLGHLCEVEDISVFEAVIKYQDELDYLLVSWPIADHTLWRVLPYIPKHAYIVFIGEITDYSTGFLGGCATDEFFDAVHECNELTAQLSYPTGRQDKIRVYRAAPSN